MAKCSITKEWRSDAIASEPDAQALYGNVITPDLRPIFATAPTPSYICPWQTVQG